MSQAADITWIAADWGTTNLRVWGIGRDGRVVAQGKSEQGMATLAQGAFESALLSLIKDWLDTPKPVIACGMVGARQGWCEAPYATVPCEPLAPTLIEAPTDHPNLSLHIISGLKQTNPADVMRGEETQIAGFLKLNPKWDGVICLPGTHSKWAHLSAGEVVSFQTFMTGEIYSFLRHNSVLKHSLAGGEWHQEAFETALSDAMSKPEMLAARLFNIRAEDLVNGQDVSVAKSRLSGFLLGAELAATRPYWLGQQVALIGSDQVAPAYAQALKVQGVPVIETDPTAMTLAGLASAYAQLKATP
ncbi:2-dehydro-3-deoxygalactonokinase [Nereida sp. MMG025]|uniref:2-dehydro-3-deoxygalactonokinase n=1 Tax=Nereida sp. MMG025 TaxID=2909981 RepID=UPI001F42F484|nr:2-dehydro-3-deoxygalactonokinase [Nereida sp. MMG025]MCF6445806.1 2-dehydro-3-deoxygalactonokinase [Nereida sp. MMG025]